MLCSLAPQDVENADACHRVSSNAACNIMNHDALQSVPQLIVLIGDRTSLDRSSIATFRRRWLVTRKALNTRLNARYDIENGRALVE